MLDVNRRCIYQSKGLYVGVCMAGYLYKTIPRLYLYLCLCLCHACVFLSMLNYVSVSTYRGPCVRVWEPRLRRGTAQHLPHTQTQTHKHSTENQHMMST